MFSEVSPQSAVSFSQLWWNRLYGLQAMGRLWQNPADSLQAAIAIHGLRGMSGPRMCHRLRGLVAGRQILDGQDPIFEVLRDRESLRRLPDNSLGRTYLSFVEHYHFQLDGIEIPGDCKIVESLEVERVTRHLRYVHDLWHVVFGYRPDVAGELCLGLVGYTQTKNPGTAIIVLGGMIKVLRTHPQLLPELREAYRRGRNCEWLPGVDWHELLPRPLNEVQKMLGVADKKDSSSILS